MKVFSRDSLVTLTILAGTLGCGVIRANDVYLSQTPLGAATGSDCANTLGVTYFNAAANWTSGKPAGIGIGPGTTVHLCGVFTGAAGATLLKAQGSGSTGNPVTIKLEPNTTLVAPYWSVNGAIILDGLSNITVTGTNNCGFVNRAEVACTESIRNTANGSASLGYANQQASTAIHAAGCSSCTFTRIGVYNMYVKDAANHTDENTQSFCLNGGGSNVQIFNTDAHDVNWCWANTPSAGGPFGGDMYNNAVWNTNHAYVVGAEGSSSKVFTGTIHDNDCHDMANWDENGNNNHHDCVHVYANTAGLGGSATNVLIYNNYLHGTFGAQTTSAVYIEGNLSRFYVFNNVVAPGDTYASNGLLGVIANGAGSVCTGISFFNNTLIGKSGTNGSGIFGEGGCSNGLIENNIIAGLFFTFIDLESGSTGWLSDNNALYQTSLSPDPFKWNGTFYGNIADYRSATGQDAASTVGNPNLTSNGNIQPGSAAAGLGRNLSASGIAALNFDTLGLARPGQGAWDIGAYRAASQVTQTVPLPPTNLITTVR